PSKPSNSKKFEKERVSPSVQKNKEGSVNSKTVTPKPTPSKSTPSNAAPRGSIKFESGRKSRSLSDGFNLLESVRRTEDVKRRKLKKADSGKQKKLKREKFHRNIKNTLGSLRTFF
ncbi:MAG: hypothetical protein LLF94_11320, partial [Chlamydiales bacterium]|nr:hypothetical protein [Chlamydiales bacterium]